MEISGHGTAGTVGAQRQDHRAKKKHTDQTELSIEWKQQLKTSPKRREMRREEKAKQSKYVEIRFMLQKPNVSFCAHREQETRELT